MAFTPTNQPDSRRPNLTYVRAEELRRLWSRVLAEASRRSGEPVVELLAMSGRERASLLRHEGLPTQREFARSAGISEPLLSLVLSRQAYAQSAAEISARRSETMRARHRARHCRAPIQSDTAK